MAVDLRRDVTELKLLLGQAKRPHVHLFLSSQIGTLEKVRPSFCFLLCPVFASYPATHILSLPHGLL
jgi:hypothetical protein